MNDIEEIRIPIINDRIDHLRVIETIASGGMAIVYKVMHEELEVYRAIKMLKPGCKKENNKRLLTEAKIAAHLSHPNIVQIYNVSIWNKSNPYIEMEFVEGTSLSEILSVRQKMPFVVAAAVASIMCKALDYAGHQKIVVYGKEYFGLVHRDIKPANILIANDGTVKLADFGIALPGNVSIHTSDATVMGTGPYISPEQIDGEKLDQRTDIYSLGAVLYEMISGVKAFPQKKMSELLRDKIKGKFQSLQSLIPDIPVECVELINKSLMRDREKRYSDAGEFGAAINAALAHFTDKSAEAIVLEYVRNNGLISIDHRTGKIRKPSNTRFLIGCAIAFVAISAAMSSILWMSGHVPGKRGRTQVVQQQSPGPDMAKAVSAAAPSPQAPQAVTDESGIPETGNAPTHGAVRQPRLASPSPSGYQAHLKAGLTAFDAHDFAAARGHFESALSARPDPASRPTIELRLLGSMVETGAAKEALQFAQDHQREDGYYYLAKGKALRKTGQIDAAGEAFELSARAGSIFGHSVAQEGLYLSAQCRDILRSQKPNLENRTKALNAWSAYQQEYCFGMSSSTECDEAERKIAELRRDK
jgi:serine/threonine-protein kinase